MNRILIVAVMLVSLSTAFADSDPVIWFDMDEANATGRIPNLGSAGSSADLTFAPYGCSLTNEAIAGKAMFSDGAYQCGARFSCPDMTDRTISFWIRRDVDTGPYTESSYPNFIAGGPGDGMRIIFGKTTLGMTVYLSNVVVFETQGSQSVLDRHMWEHLTFTYANCGSGSVDFKCYFNGTLLYSKNGVALNGTVVGGTGARQMCIGGNGDNRPICCCTDEFRIWNRALSADEVRAEFERVTPDSGKSLLARWQMDSIDVDGQNRYVRDSSELGMDLHVGPGVTTVVDGLKGTVLRTDGTKSTWAEATVPARFADYTLTAWINQSSDSIYDNIGKIGMNNGGPRYFLGGGDALIFPTAFNLGAAVLGSNTLYPALAAKDHWSHFTMRVKNVWDSGKNKFVRTYSIFMNGVQTAGLVSENNSITWQEGASNIYMFNLSTASNLDRPFEGRTADVRLYARALDDAVIQEIARGPASISAGADFSVAGDTAELRGTVAPHGDDYFVDGFAGSVRWSLVSAPQGGEGCAIMSPGSVATTVTLPVEGEYVFRLVSEAGGYASTDDVTVTRVSAIGAAPSVSLAASAAVVRPLRLHLAGTATGAERVFWRKVSGAGGVWFEPDNAAETDITFSEADSYVLRLTAESGGATASADVTVSVTDSSGTVALDDGLKIHWPMDIGNVAMERISGASNSIRPDYTNSIFTVGARLHGISAVSNNAYVTTDRSLSFERSADGSFGYSTQPTSKWVSVSMWIYRDSRITHEVCVPYLLSAHQSLGLRFGRLDTGADGFTVQQQGLYGGTAELYFNPPSRSMVDRWTHVYALYDRADGEEANFALYLDGERQTPAKSSGFPYKARIPNSPIEICGIQPGRQVGPQMGNVKKGNNGDYYSATFPGTIDDIRIYNRPLSDAEIRTLASRPNLSENLPPVFSTDIPLSLSLIARKAATLPLAVFDDGLPTNGVLTCEWQVISGDADSVVLDDSAQPASSVIFTKAGNYVLRLTATDGERTSYSQPVSVNVLPIGTKVVLR